MIILVLTLAARIITNRGQESCSEIESVICTHRNDAAINDCEMYIYCHTQLFNLIYLFF